MLFFPRGRCANGYDCNFCHYEHEKRKRRNKKKAAKKITALGRGARSLSAQQSVGLTVPGCSPQTGAAQVMPIGYQQLPYVQLLPQQGQVVYSAAQTMPVASQHGVLAQLSNGAYCVVQPEQMLAAAPGVAPGVAGIAPAVAAAPVPHNEFQQQQQ